MDRQDIPLSNEIRFPDNVRRFDGGQGPHRAHIPTYNRRAGGRGRRPRGSWLPLILLMMALSLGAGYLGGRIGLTEQSQTPIPAAGEETMLPVAYVPSNDVADVASNPDAPLSVVQIAAEAADSVVEITTETVITGSRMQQYVSEGAGSGVIISTDGYVITNNHVVEGAGKIAVRLANGTDHAATLIGTDSRTDIAVIKIDAENLKAAVPGDSDTLQVGEPAVAIGNPLGQLGGTVTEGIISALDRAITIDNETMTLLQTSAAINPGNSGGGLFNQYGELIGIVNAKSSGSDIEGLGFAIPINTARMVADELIRNGYVTGRPSLGATLLDVLDSRTASYYRVNQLGVYVYEVTDQASGLQSGDRLLTADGREIDSSTTIQSILNSLWVGDTITLTLQRNGQALSLEVVLTESRN